MRLNEMLFSFVLVTLIGCGEKSNSNKQTSEISKYVSDGNVEAVSIFGEPLYRGKFSGGTLSKLQRDLTVALQNYNQNPDDEDAIIWYGRRLAYLSRYNDAIEVFSKGLDKHPESYKLLRHRGHRFITLRKFDAAIEDLKLADSLAPSSPTLMEPDGIPNKLNRPLSSTQFNIWYHLALAYYLKGNFDEAEKAFRYCLELSINDDLLVASTDWLYMTLYKLNRVGEAKPLLDQVDNNAVMIENDSYFKRIKMYKGLIPAEKLLELKPTNEENSIGLATQGYGVGLYFLMKGNRVRAVQVFQKVIDTKMWDSFGYIAAETELYRMGEKSKSD